MRLGLPDRFLHQVTGGHARSLTPKPPPTFFEEQTLSRQPVSLAATFLLTLIIGTQYHISFQNIVLPEESGIFALILKKPSMLLWGMPYSLSLMLILLIHELGHFFACRFHRLEATLPFFIPAPTRIGTFGAFIKIKTPFSSKKSLFDVGIARPPGRIPCSHPGDLHRNLPVPTHRKKFHPDGHHPRRTGHFHAHHPNPEGPDRRPIRSPHSSHRLCRLVRTAGHIVQSVSDRPTRRRSHCVLTLREKSYYAGIAAVVILMALGILYWQGWLFWARSPR